MSNVWRLKTRDLALKRTLLAGILNATPDSFSDGGRFAANPNVSTNSKNSIETDDANADEQTTCSFEIDLRAVVETGLRLVREGAAILDVGGESTRPGAAPVDEAEELRRVVPVVRALRDATDVPISVDTYRPAVADAALEAGAEIVNDVAAGRFISSENRFAGENERDFSEEMREIVRRRGAAVVLTHMRGVPRTMQDAPRYERDVVEEVADFLRRRRDSFVEAGVELERVAFDPGVGFGKTFEQNWALIRRADELLSLGGVLFYGCSRKRFLGETWRRFEERERDREPEFCALVDSDSREFRDAATAATSALLASKGVAVLRVHNVWKNAFALEFAALGSGK